MEWIKDVGEIHLSDNNEWVWLVPAVHVTENECCLTSAWFSFAEETWRLVIMPSDGEGHCHANCDFFSLFLWKKNMRPPCHVYSVELGVKAVDGTTAKSRSGDTVPYYGFGGWDIYNIGDLCEREILFGLLKIFCVIKEKEVDDNDNDEETVDAENECKAVATEKDVIVEAKGSERLAQDFRRLLHEKWSSDVILKTSDSEFHVHKMVLWARSRVFASMFENDMAEKTSGVVDIPDCTTEAFEAFLQFLYTGSAGAISPDNVLNLYYTADKYLVDELKAECVEYMKSTLSSETVCGVLSLSLQHNESNLLGLATRFFCRNVKKIIKTAQWQKYLTENPAHANELYITAIKAFHVITERCKTAVTK